MKKFLHNSILATLILLSISATAKTRLSISTTMPTTLKVVIDGKKFYSQDNNLNINNLRPGNHSISIYYIKTGKNFNNYYNYGHNSYWKKAVSREVNVRNNYSYDITINRFGRAFYDQDYYSSNNNNYHGRSDARSNDDDNNYSDNDDEYYGNTNFDFENDGYNENYNDFDYFKNQGANINDKNDDIKNNEFDDKHNSSSDYKTYNQAMSNSMFNDLKETLQSTNFENSKLQVAKQSIDKFSINTYQVKEIMNMLSMETNKLDFAKYAYSKTRDANNYLTVLNSLNMQSSKDDLLRYIKNK